MIIYISTEERASLLDELVKKYEWDFVQEVFEKNSLSAFINKKIQVIADLPYIVIERSCVKETEREFDDIIESMRMMWDTHIILLEDELLDEDGETINIRYQEHRTVINKYQDNLADKLEYLLKGERIPQEDLYDGIWIGIMSANSGAGSTDAAIGLTNFIARNNGKVCYVEANESGDLGAMAEYYGMEKMADNHYLKDGVDYWHQSIDSEKKFVVLDLGKYSSTKINLYNQCKIKIVISDSKPYRMTDALNVLRLAGDDETIKLWLNYGNDEDFETVKEKFLHQISQKVFHIQYHEDMFTADDVAYYELMKDYMKLDEPTKKLTFFLNKDFVKNVKQKLPDRKKKDKGQVILPEDVELDKQERSVIEELESVKENVQAEESVEEGKEELKVAIMPEKALEEEEMTIAEDLIAEEEEPAETIKNQRVLVVADETYLMTDEGISQVTSQNNEVVEELEEVIPRSEEIDLINEPEPYVVTTTKKKKVTSSFLILALLIGAGCFALANAVPHVHGFFFNNQAVVEGTTERIDPNLNIDEDIKISVLAVEDADGYEVSYSTDADFDKKKTVIIEVQTADQAIETLAAGKTYYIRVRAFKYNEDGTKVFGEYTDVQKIEM